MAKCDEGYLCSVCGGDVAEMIDSDLYLRYVLGWVEPEVLHTTPDRHLRCNPALAQFIVADGFQPVLLEGEFDKRRLDESYRQQREELITRAWHRLREVIQLGLPIVKYPLPELKKS